MKGIKRLQATTLAEKKPQPKTSKKTQDFIPKSAPKVAERHAVAVSLVTPNAHVLPVQKAVRRRIEVQQEQLPNSHYLVWGATTGIAMFCAYVIGHFSKL